MMATVPVVFSLPSDVQTKGVEVAMFATLKADYTQQSGGAVIPDGTVVYFDSTLNNGAGDYAAASATSDFTFSLTVSAGQATVNLPDTFVKSGQIVIGVGGAPTITFNPATATSPAGTSTPTAFTNPTNYFGLFEYAIDGSGWNIDLSLVDQIGFPFTVTATPALPRRMKTASASRRIAATCSISVAAISRRSLPTQPAFSKVSPRATAIAFWLRSISSTARPAPTFP